MTFYAPLDSLTARQRELSQSQARPARIRLHVDVAGVGESRAKVAFGTMMLEEPTFSWGAVMRSPAPKGTLPLLSAVIVELIANGQGMYTGAEVGFVVEGSAPTTRVTFTLTFEGVSLRAVNQAMRSSSKTRR